VPASGTGNMYHPNDTCVQVVVPTDFYGTTFGVHIALCPCETVMCKPLAQSETVNIELSFSFVDFLSQILISLILFIFFF